MRLVKRRNLTILLTMIVLLASLPSEDPPVLNKGRVLVAEDNPVNQLLVTTLLRKLGYSSQVVGNGLEALDALRQGKFDLILMDCQMPEMDGFEATAAIAPWNWKIKASR